MIHSLALALTQALPGLALEPMLAAVRNVPSYAASNALAAAAPDASLLEALHARLASAAHDEAVARRLLYLEARALLKARRFDQGLAMLTNVAGTARDAPEPSLLLATELRGSGEVDQAQRALRSALESGPRRDRRLWDAWLGLGFIPPRQNSVGFP